MRSDVLYRTASHHCTEVFFLTAKYALNLNKNLVENSRKHPFTDFELFNFPMLLDILNSLVRDCARSDVYISIKMNFCFPV